MATLTERPWWPGDQQQFREALRYWISNNLDPTITVRTWWRRLADAGLTAPTWPRVHGGLAVTTPIQEIIEAELAASGAVAPPVDNVGFRAIAPALRQFLHAEQIATWMEPLLRGEHSWALLAHEPGLDDGVVQCRAERDWKWITIDGVKRLDDPGATHGLLVARADPKSEGRKGLDCFIADLREPGTEIAPDAVRFTGHRFPHDRLVGEPGKGWDVVKHVLPYLDRSLAGRIRRGLVHVPAGETAGALDLTVAEAIASYQPAAPPGVERRHRV